MSKFINFTRLVDKSKTLINMDLVKSMDPVNKLFDGYMRECTNIYYENHRVTVVASLDDITDMISEMNDGDFVDLTLTSPNTGGEYNYDSDDEFTLHIVDDSSEIPHIPYTPEDDTPPTIWMFTARKEHSGESNTIYNHITLPIESQWQPVFPNNLSDGPYYRTIVADSVLPNDQNFIYIVYKCHYKSQGGKRPYRNELLHNAYPVKVFITKQSAISYISTNNSGGDVGVTGIKYIGIKQPFDNNYKLLLGYAPTGTTMYTLQHSAESIHYGEEYF